MSFSSNAPEAVIDKALFQELLKFSELSKLDFKSEPYRFDTDNLTSKFIKDIIALTNTNPPDRPGYILIGIKDLPEEGRRERIGVMSHPDDATLQQIVRDKVAIPPNFIYVSFTEDNKIFGVIRVMPMRSLCQTTKDFGVLRKNVIYTRKGTRNSEASAEDLHELVEARLSAFTMPQIVAEAEEIDAISKSSYSKMPSAPWPATVDLVSPDTIDKGDKVRVLLHAKLNTKWKDPLAIVKGFIDSNDNFEAAKWPLKWRQQPMVTIAKNYSALCMPDFTVEMEWREAAYVLSSRLWSRIKEHAVGQFVAQNANTPLEATVRAVGLKEKPYLYLNCPAYDSFLKGEWPYYRGLEAALRRTRIATNEEVRTLSPTELRTFIAEKLIPSGQLLRLIPANYKEIFETRSIVANDVTTVLGSLIREA